MPVAFRHRTSVRQHGPKLHGGFRGQYDHKVTEIIIDVIRFGVEPVRTIILSILYFSANDVTLFFIGVLYRLEAMLIGYLLNNKLLGIIVRGTAEYQAICGGTVVQPQDSLITIRQISIFDGVIVCSDRGRIKQSSGSSLFKNTPQGRVFKNGIAIRDFVMRHLIGILIKKVLSAPGIQRFLGLILPRSSTFREGQEFSYFPSVQIVCSAYYYIVMPWTCHGIDSLSRPTEIIEVLNGLTDLVYRFSVDLSYVGNTCFLRRICRNLIPVRRLSWRLCKTRAGKDQKQNTDDFTCSCTHTSNIEDCL